MYKRFEQLLQESNVTAYRVAQETGVSTATLTSWKQGKYVPKDEKLRKIADYFNVELAWLKGESDYRTKEEMLRSINRVDVAVEDNNTTYNIDAMIKNSNSNSKIDFETIIKLFQDDEMRKRLMSYANFLANEQKQKQEVKEK